MTNWSKEQQTIFAMAADVNSGNVVVRARAGTGKSTTITQALAHIPNNLRALLVAFNKDVATELSRRLGDAGAKNADAKTLHALGNRMLTRAFRCRLEGSAARLLVEANCDAPKDAVRLIVRLMSKAKNCLMPKAITVASLLDLALEFDILPHEQIESRRRVKNERDEWEMVRVIWDIELIAKVALDALNATMNLCNSRERFLYDFDDMVWLPVVWDLHAHNYDLVVVDEAQDMSPVQLALAQGAVKEGGRLFIVGDDRQAIYGFRGADSGSLDRMKVELDATELPLPITYRCPRLVVEMAQEIVPDYRACDDALDGRVDRLHPDLLTDVARPGCFVLGRSNRAVVGAAMSLIRAGVAAEVTGRDIGKSLGKLIARIAGKRTKDIPTMMTRLQAYDERERARIAAQTEGREEAEQKLLDRLDDQVGTISTLCEGLGTMAELMERIRDLFGSGEKGSRVTCSTVHRAKGMERDLVIVLADTMRGDQEEELNIYYVAITRTKSHLVMLSKEYKA